MRGPSTWFRAHQRRWVSSSKHHRAVRAQTTMNLYQRIRRISSTVSQTTPYKHISNNTFSSNFNRTSVSLRVGTYISSKRILWTPIISSPPISAWAIAVAKKTSQERGANWKPRKGWSLLSKAPAVRILAKAFLSWLQRAMVPTLRRSLTRSLAPIERRSSLQNSLSFISGKLRPCSFLKIVKAHWVPPSRLMTALGASAIPPLKARCMKSRRWINLNY